MKYTLKTDKIHSEENKLFLVYGIIAADSEKQVISSIADIFCDKIKAERFINLCNSRQLSVIHLNDVINDMLESA